ncbi:MAG: metallophosphoesterase, partial [Calditrichia bacterium]|nr:metallophosphoesterase [Calditrichia bacterium]
LIIFIFLYCFIAMAQKNNQFIFDENTAKTPWSIPETDDPDNKFNFAIVSDRTGGMRPGIFAEAIEKLNLLQPDFVMSIGDLIDGYSENEKYITAQWEEFESIIAKLDAPFFRLAGNHDISNKTMEELWKKRYGKTYYHFLFKEVLFLCLNTDDPPYSNISEAQTEYFKKVLAENKNVRWTFIFIHIPLWQYEDKCGFEKIENMIKDRKHTLFSGHHHNYLKGERNGYSYITLATTGGGSEMRGPQFGEFDHIAWVTMKDDEPVIANIDLEGIRDENVVTEEMAAMVEPLRRGLWFYLNPVVNNSVNFKKLNTSILLINNAQEPLKIKGELPRIHNLSFTPESIDLTVAPGEKKKLPLIIKAEKEQYIPDLSEIKIELKAEYNPDNSPVLSQKKTCELVVDWIHSCPVNNNPVIIDAQLNDWEINKMIVVDQPGYIEEDWNWKGASDGMFRFSVKHDEKFIYIIIISKDDKLIHSQKNIDDLQDKFFIRFDLVSKDRPLISAFCSDNSFKIVLIPGKSETRFYSSDSIQEKIESKCRKDKNGLITEIAIPREYLKKINGRGNAFRLNIGYMDHDVETNTKPSILWWKPVWNSDKNYNGSGVFHFQE